MRFAVIDDCPVPWRLARKVRRLKRDVPTATLNSCYRGERAKRQLHRLGKRTQGELYAGFRAGKRGFYPANPPGFSSHELRSDGNPVYGAPKGRKIPYWQVGMDWDDRWVNALIHAAKKRGWVLVRPYASGSEYHHLSFVRKPRWRKR